MSNFSTSCLVILQQVSKASFVQKLFYASGFQSGVGGPFRVCEALSEGPRKKFGIGLTWLIVLLPTPVHPGGKQSMLARFIFCFLCVCCDHTTRLPYGVTKRKVLFIGRYYYIVIIVSFSCDLAEAQSFSACVFSLAKKAAKHFKKIARGPL